MFWIPPALIKGILNLELNACATLGFKRSLADFQLLTVLLMTVDWNETLIVFWKNRLTYSNSTKYPVVPNTLSSAHRNVCLSRIESSIDIY